MDDLIKSLKRRDIVIGIIILAIVALIVYYFFRKPSKPKLELPTTTPTIEEELERSFNLTIPEDVEKAELRDVAGGSSQAIATRDYKLQRFTHTVLADLPDLSAGEFYQGWLVKGDVFVSTGKLRLAKGGYLLEFSANTDYSDYDQVVITLEKTFDNTTEIHILEGSF